MKIAHISDLHITSAGPTCGVAPMAENLIRVVAHINSLQPDVVLVSGDITHNGLPEEARLAAKLLGKLSAPYYITAGNHDNRDVLRAAFPHAALPAKQADHLSYALETGGLRLIALDSTDPDAPNGRICPARLAWLEARLAESSAPTLVLLHHPPMKCAVEETDNPPLQGAAALGAVIARHPHIQRLLCGHIHLMAQALWHGTLACTAPSIGMRLSWSPDQPTPSRFLASPPAYLWHMDNADGTLITHEFTLDSPEGPYEFC